MHRSTYWIIFKVMDWREQEKGHWMVEEEYCGMMDNVLVCSKWGGGLLFSLPMWRERKTRGMGQWEASYGQARMEGAVCVGVEPSVRLASLSVTSYLGQPDRHITDAKTHTHTYTHTSRSWSSVSYWHYQAAKAARRRDAPHNVSQFDRRPGSSTLRLAGWLCSKNTAFITLMHW